MVKCKGDGVEIGYEDSQELVCVEVPQETLAIGSDACARSLGGDDDTANVFNKLLDIESQAFSERDNWPDCGVYGVDYSFSESLRSRTIALAERAINEDDCGEDGTGPNFKVRRPIDMNVIERIKALRNNSTALPRTGVPHRTFKK